MQIYQKKPVPLRKSPSEHAVPEEASLPPSAFQPTQNSAEPKFDLDAAMQKKFTDAFGTRPAPAQPEAQEAVQQDIASTPDDLDSVSGGAVTEQASGDANGEATKFGNFENVLRSFKKNCAKSGVIKEIRKREAYEKPSVRRKKKSEEARRHKWK